MADEKFYFDSLQDSQSISDFLQSLTEGFARGELKLSSDGESITLNPSGLLGFTVKAKRKRGSSKMTIRVSWKDRGEETPDDSKSLTVA